MRGHKFKEGVPVGKLAQGHAWLTLENGAVIDATILASRHRKAFGDEALLSFADAIYYTGKPGTPVVRHIPMLTGFVYHQKVLTGFDRLVETYCSWYQDYYKAMANLDITRMVPGLIGH